MNLLQFIESNISTTNPVLTGIQLSIIFIIVFEFYHLLFSCVFALFRR